MRKISSVRFVAIATIKRIIAGPGDDDPLHAIGHDRVHQSGARVDVASINAAATAA